MEVNIKREIKIYHNFELFTDGMITDPSLIHPENLPRGILKNSRDLSPRNFLPVGREIPEGSIFSV